MVGVKRGFSVSLGILAVAIFAIFYAAWLPATVFSVMEFLEISMEEWMLLVLIIALSNAEAYVFVSAVPLYLLRERNSFLQFLAHVLSSTTAAGVALLVKDPLPNLSWLESPLVAGLYLALPFIIIVYISIRS